MPELSFELLGARTVKHAATPQLALQLRVSNTPADEPVSAIMLRCQVQIEAQRRQYRAVEQEGLRDLFGDPSRWSTTLKTLLWTHVHATVPAFTGSTLVDVMLPCSADLEVVASKYFHSLEGGEVPLVVLFSGSVFYERADGALQAVQIPWSKEARFKLPVAAWQETIDHYFPNMGFLKLDRDVLDKLYRYKVQNGLPTMERAILSLLPPDDRPTQPPGDA